MHYLSKLTLGTALGCLAHAAMADTPSAPREASPPTYAYAKCVYKPSSQASTDASTRFEWAVDENGKRYRIPGRWWSQQLNSEKNMFMTDFLEKAALHGLCDHTLSYLGHQGTVLDVLAGYDEGPHDHTFWSEFKYAGDKIDRIVVFGDSFSDTSKVFKSSLRRFPHADSWSSGRFSNGPVWSEYVGKSLGLPVYSWAVSDAAYDVYYQVPGIRRQVSTWLDYMERVNHFEPERTLFVIWVGMDEAVNHEGMDEGLNGLAAEIKRIHDRGGRHIAVMTHPDLSKAPFVATAEEADYQQKRARLAELQLRTDEIYLKYSYGIEIRLIETKDLFHDMIERPENHGFEVASAPCLDIQGSAHADYLEHQTKRPACTDADTHVFWDAVHPTTKAHEVIGASVAEALRTHFGARLPYSKEE